MKYTILELYQEGETFWSHQSGRKICSFGKNSTSSTYSIMLLELHRCLFNRQWSPSLWYKWLFSASNTLFIECLVLLLRQTTGHMDIPKVQQQHMHPQSNQRTLTGIVLLSTLLTLVTVALYSSGATLALRACWNSTSNLLLSPNLKEQKEKVMISLYNKCY